MKEEEARSVLTLAGFKVERMWELANRYWPRPHLDPEDTEQYERDRDNAVHYFLLRQNSPWWLAQTEMGLIQIGWRKRVISIDWSATDLRSIVTEDQVTKGETLVHAYSIPKALEYLTKLHKLFVLLVETENFPT